MDKGTVFVTGAGQRLGCAITISLLESGYTVIAHYRNNREELKKYLLESGKGSQIIWWQGEFPKDLQRLELELPWERITAIITCAAQFSTGNLFDADLTSQLQVNALVPLEIVKLYRKLCKSGNVITLIDSNIDRVNSNFQNYRISKLLLGELTRQMAVTIGKGFRVNGIAPGTVIPPKGGEDSSYKKARELAPTGREVSVESICSTVHFLLNNQDITAEIIAIDGGVHAL